jgi:hypothetical protein
MLGEPLVVLRGGVVHHILDPIDARGAARIGVGVVHLDFDAGRGPAAGLVLRVKVHAGVGLGLGHDFALPLEVLELALIHGTGVIEMGRFAVGDDMAVFDLEAFGVFFGDLPAIEVLAVEEAVPAVLVRFGGFFGAGEGDRREQEEQGGEGAAKSHEINSMKDD